VLGDEIDILGENSKLKTYSQTKLPMTMGYVHNILITSYLEKMNKIS